VFVFADCWEVCDCEVGRCPLACGWLVFFCFSLGDFFLLPILVWSTPPVRIFNCKKTNTVAIKKDSQLSILAPYPTCLLLFKQSQQLVFMNYPRQLRCNESQMFRETVDDTSIKPRVRSYWEPPTIPSSYWLSTLGPPWSAAAGWTAAAPCPLMCSQLTYAATLTNRNTCGKGLSSKFKVYCIIRPPAHTQYTIVPWKRLNIMYCIVLNTYQNIYINTYFSNVNSSKIIWKHSFNLRALPF